MAIKAFEGGKVQLFDKDTGDFLSLGKVYVYEPGTTTAKTSYTTSALSVANANPVILDAYGRAEIWVSGNAKFLVQDADGGSEYEVDNYNRDESGSSTVYNLATNGSFEIGTTTPDSWTVTLYTGGTQTLDAAASTHGAQSIKFTSAGSGGGYITQSAFSQVANSQTYLVRFTLKSSVADVRNLVQVKWYDLDQVFISNTTVYDNSTTNPTSFASRQLRVTAPATAAFAKLELYGCHSSDATTGSTWYDDVEFTNLLLRDANTPIYVEEFGAVGDGATDDLTPLTNFINALLANTNLEGRFLKKTYAVSAALPDINVSNVRLVGFRGAAHDVGSLFTGTFIKKIGAASGTILTVAPTEGASAQKLCGIQLLGIGFDCNSLAVKGLVIKSVTNSDIDVCVLNATTTGFELNVATTLGEAADTQFNRIRYIGRQVESAAGISMRLIGNATANVSLNKFELVDIVHKDGIALISENADNNLWEVIRIYQAGGGSAVNSIEWRGGATEAQSTRDEQILKLTSTLAAIAKGTGSYTVGANRISIAELDKGNATPTPTEETGTTIFDGEWRTYTPTITAGTGTFTTVSATGRYLRRRRTVLVSIMITITANGTAASYVIAPLPVVSGSSSGSQVIMGEETQATGITVRGLITQGASAVNIQDTAGAYPGADGRTIAINGEYETA